MPEFPPTPPHAVASDEVVLVPSSEIREAPWQARRYYDQRLQAALAESIAQDGLLEPLIVRRVPGEAGYELLAGHQRLAAVQTLARQPYRELGYIGWRGADRSDLPVRVTVREADDVEARRITFAENAHRADVCAWERAHALEALAVSLRAARPGTTVSNRELHKMCGLPESTVSECLRIAATLPEATLREAGCVVRPFAYSPDYAELDFHTVRRLSHATLRKIAAEKSPEVRRSALVAALDRARVQARGRAAARAHARRVVEDAAGAPAPVPTEVSDDGTLRFAARRRGGRPPLPITKKWARKLRVEAMQRETRRESSRHLLASGEALLLPTWSRPRDYDYRDRPYAIDVLVGALCYLVGKEGANGMPSWYALGSGGVLVIDELPDELGPAKLAAIRNHYVAAVDQLERMYERAVQVESSTRQATVHAP